MLRHQLLDLDVSVIVWKKSTLKIERDKERKKKKNPDTSGFKHKRLLTWTNWTVDMYKTVSHGVYVCLLSLGF